MKKIKLEKLADWNEVNDALREIAENELFIEKRETKLNREINELKEAAEADTRDAQNAVSILETRIKDFVKAHEGEIEGRSKQLFFGRTGFRASSSVSIPRGREEEVISRLYELGMKDCVTMKESVNKDALKQYDDRRIEAAGAKRVVKDAWFYEVDRTKLST